MDREVYRNFTETPEVGARITIERERADYKQEMDFSPAALEVEGSHVKTESKEPEAKREEKGREGIRSGIDLCSCTVNYAVAPATVILENPVGATVSGDGRRKGDAVKSRDRSRSSGILRKQPGRIPRC